MMAMRVRAVNANLVIVGGVCLTALALLMLGWQFIESFGRLGDGQALQGSAQSWNRMLLIVAVTTSGIVSALLAGLVYNSRACHRAETRLERMAHRLPGGFYVFRLSEDGQSTYEFLTVNATNILGVSHEQVIQDPGVARRLVVMDDRERLNAALVQSHKAVSRLEIDFRIKKPDGEVRWVRTLAVPARTSDNDVVWNGHLFDITDIRETEQALRETTDRLHDAQSVASFGDWTCELESGVVTWSPQVYQLLDRDPARGPPSLAEVADLPLEGPQPMADAFERAQNTGEAQYFEASTRLSDNRVVTLDVIVLPVSDASGKLVGMRGTMHDITPRKALEQRLSAAKDAADSANQAKSQFLATMSHEIRTPLNGMLGILELISLTPVNPEIRTALQDVRESGESLQRIIDDILDFSKVEAGKLEIRPEPSNLLRVVESVHRIYAGSASGVGLEFRLDVDPGISPTLMLDTLRVRQILSNFVSNAIKFTPKGRVELRVLLAGREGNKERLRFEVQDTGIGIAPSEQQKLFEPFEQAQSNASRFGGTGLGLSITRRLAELMGGSVSMSSELGTGTTMTLEVEAAVVDTEHVAPETPHHNRAHDELAGMVSSSVQRADPGILILVVDDHPVNRIVMRNQITALGYAVEDVGNAADALERWRTGRFSLVLTDLNMPVSSGFDLSRRIREAEASAERFRTPIIACSANVIAGVIEECHAAGMDDYISKPTRLMELSEKLNHWLPASNAGHGDGPALTASQGQVTEHLATSTVAEECARADTTEPRISHRTLAYFREVNDVDVGALLEAVEHGDMSAVVHYAHRIKGACGFIGATGLASVCGMMEQAARANDQPGVNWLVDSFHRELEQLNAHIDA